MNYEQDDNWWADKWEDEADQNDYNEEDYGPYGRKDEDEDTYCTDGYRDNEREDFHADEAVGYVDYFEDGPYLD